jgi:hypothetical protein
MQDVSSPPFPHFWPKPTYIIHTALSITSASTWIKSSHPEDVGSIEQSWQHVKPQRIIDCIHKTYFLSVTIIVVGINDCKLNTILKQFPLKPQVSLHYQLPINTLSNGLDPFNKPLTPKSTLLCCRPLLLHYNTGAVVSQDWNQLFGITISLLLYTWQLPKCWHCSLHHLLCPV